MNGVWDPGIILNDIPLDEKEERCEEWAKNANPHNLQESIPVATIESPTMYI